MKMPSFKNMLKKCRANPLLCIAVLIILVVIVICILRETNIIDVPMPNTHPNTEGFQNDVQVTSQDDLEPQHDEVIVALFYADWCGYCQNLNQLI